MRVHLLMVYNTCCQKLSVSFSICQYLSVDVSISHCVSVPLSQYLSVRSAELKNAWLNVLFNNAVTC
jgi:hypothetical protein